MSTLKDMAQEIRTAIANGETIEELQDNSGEWVEGFLPVYNDKIISEWQQMPSDYDNRGSKELGHSLELNIINLMSADLYLYYSDLWQQALTDVAHEIEELA
jgi:hypothetical protein